MVRHMQRFVCQTGANVAIVFGLSAVPIMVAIGSAVDYTRAATSRGILQDSLDAATLMATKDGHRTPTAVTSSVATALAVQLPPGRFSSWRITSATADSQRVRVCAEGVVATAMLGIAGYQAMTVASCTETVRDLMNLEVALALDVTGSMATNNRIGALRTAANTLVNTLLPSPDPLKTVNISVVPFVTAVNIRNEHFQWAWIDQTAQARYHGVNFDLEAGRRVSHLDLFNRMRVDWRGCVEARAEPYDLTDTPPNPSTPDTLFVPYFWPDEPDSGVSYPDGGGYQNRYMNDAVTGTASERQRSILKYGTRTPTIDEIPSSTSGPNKSCPTPIVPLTSDRARLNTAINDLMPWNESGTNIAQGLYWGWAVLSPGEPFSQGRPYTDRTTQKALVLLTDGENVVFGGYNNHNRSDYTSYGYLAGGRLNSTNASTAASFVNTKVETLCERVKAEGIRLYTITFELNSTAVRDLFRRCASEPHLYYNSPTTAQLNSVFQSIANDLSRLRIAR